MGRSYSYSELAYEFWGPHWETEGMQEESVKSCIFRTRQKLNEVSPGAGMRYIEQGNGQYKFVSDLENTEGKELFLTSEANMANAFEALDKMLQEMENIQEKIDRDTTAFQLKKCYSQHLAVLFFRYEQLHKEVSEKYLQGKNLRNSTYQINEPAPTIGEPADNGTAVFKQRLEDLGEWVSGAVSAMDLLSYELDEAIRAFINDNIDDLSAVLDSLPENKQTTQVLFACVDSFDSCSELYEVLFERKTYLEPEELEELIYKAKKNFDPELWSLWDMED